MNRRTMPEIPAPPAYMFAMSPERDTNGEPVAFALVFITPEIDRAMAEAYDTLSRGMPGSITIPIAAPVAMKRCLKEIDQSVIPHAKALECCMIMLTLEGARGWFKLGEQLADVFIKFAKHPTKPNADLVISRYQPPRLRTRLRGRRHHYTSMPATPLEPSDWNTIVAPRERPIRALGSP